MCPGDLNSYFLNGIENINYFHKRALRIPGPGQTHYPDPCWGHHQSPNGEARARPHPAPAATLCKVEHLPRVETEATLLSQEKDKKTP